MATSKTDISNWLDKLYADDDLTHMIVVCDTLDYEDYPVYITKDEDVHEEKEKHEANMQRVMEVYSKRHTKESQLAEFRAFHYD